MSDYNIEQLDSFTNAETGIRYAIHLYDARWESDKDFWMVTQYDTEAGQYIERTKCTDFEIAAARYAAMVTAS